MCVVAVCANITLKEPVAHLVLPVQFAEQIVQ